MGWLRGILLPSTDAVVLIQAIVVTGLFSLLLARFWNRPGLRLLIIGLGLITAGLFGLRAVH